MISGVILAIHLLWERKDADGVTVISTPLSPSHVDHPEPPKDSAVFEVVRPPQTSLNDKHRKLKTRFFSCERFRAGWLCRSRYSEGCFEVEGMTPVPAIVLCQEEIGPDLPSCGSGQSYFCFRVNQ